MLSSWWYQKKGQRNRHLPACVSPVCRYPAPAVSTNNDLSGFVSVVEEPGHPHWAVARSPDELPGYTKCALTAQRESLTAEKGAALTALRESLTAENEAALAAQRESLTAEKEAALAAQQELISAVLGPRSAVSRTHVGERRPRTAGVALLTHVGERGPAMLALPFSRSRRQRLVPTSASRSLRIPAV